MAVFESKGLKHWRWKFCGSSLPPWYQKKTGKKYSWIALEIWRKIHRISAFYVFIPSFIPHSALSSLKKTSLPGGVARTFRPKHLNLMNKRRLISDHHRQPRGPNVYGSASAKGCFFRQRTWTYQYIELNPTEPFCEHWNFRDGINLIKFPCVASGLFWKGENPENGHNKPFVTCGNVTEVPSVREKTELTRRGRWITSCESKGCFLNLHMAMARYDMMVPTNLPLSPHGFWIYQKKHRQHLGMRWLIKPASLTMQPCKCLLPMSLKAPFL